MRTPYQKCVQLNSQINWNLLVSKAKRSFDLICIQRLGLSECILSADDHIAVHAPVQQKA